MVGAAPPAEPARPPGAGRRGASLLLGTLLVVGLAVLVLSKLGARKASNVAVRAERTVPAATPGLNLAGRWQVQFSKTLAGPPPAPAVKEVFLETDGGGSIRAAGVVLTDPPRGGAGAGYRIAPDGRRRLNETVALLTASPRGTPLLLEYIPLPAWVPRRTRLWRALEGVRRRPEDIRYLLLESIEDDYLVQAGITESGFLSYAFFSPAYASGRGVDSLSGVIHPEPGSSLHGFRNLVWDLSGEADFMAMEVHATLSGPEGAMDRITLKR